MISAFTQISVYLSYEFHNILASILNLRKNGLKYISLDIVLKYFETKVVQASKKQCKGDR